MNSSNYRILKGAVVVLAAGAGRRMGKVKPLLPYGGGSLVENALKAALGCGMDTVAVVVGYEAQAVKEEIGKWGPLIIENPEWAEGIGSSIRTAIRAIQQKDPGIDGIILMVCDQPFVTFSVLKALIKKQEETRMPITASRYDGIHGTPALFHRRFFPDLSHLEGDRGAGLLIKENASLVATVDFPAGGVDIDTGKDYEQLRAQKRTHDY